MILEVRSTRHRKVTGVFRGDCVAILVLLKGRKSMHSVYTIKTRHGVDGKLRHEFPSYEEASKFRDRINRENGGEDTAYWDQSRNYAWNYGWSTKK